MANVYEKLLNVQSELKAPKSQYNSFGKYNYRSAEDIVEAAKPLCKANGILLTLSDSVELVGDKRYIKATARVVDVTDPSGVVEVSASAREPLDKKGMDDSQITGAASSYARKYALNGLFAIDDTKDADAVNNSADKKSSKPTQNTAPKQPPAELDKVVCPQCGKQVVSQMNKQTKKMCTAQEVLQMCGGICPDCMKLQRNAVPETI